ncbi:substrate-binding domain-containing protein [Nocardia sp. NPDC058705]|uniref:substrate-binding domain-containing protein n=1 Tax=Nocardia sp. NPDC058705 TaxID=3346609 RepID=UPI0036B3DB90
MDIPLELILSAIGLVVASAAFVREFVLVGRRRLGYRFQMDTPVTGETETTSLVGALNNLSTPEVGGETLDLSKLSVVLIRIENSGTLAVDTDDYTMRGADPLVGLHVEFPGREVIGLAVTELDGPPADNLGPGSGIGKRTKGEGERFAGVIDLPKVQLERRQHYKILAVLKRVHGDGEPKEPILVGGVKRGKVVPTTSHGGPSKKLMALSGFLVALIAVQGVIALQPDPPPSDCAGGELTLVGSTAMAPMIKRAAETYGARCTDAKFSFDFHGTTQGHDKMVESAPARNMVSIGEGPKLDSYRTLSERAIAAAVYSVILHRDLNLENLTVQQVQDLYAGRVKNWQQVGGPDLPVTLVDRQPGSGTMNAINWRLGITTRESDATTSCLGRPPERRHCRADTTTAMLDAVAEIPGAIGYVETAAVTDGVKAIMLGGVAATKENMLAHTYPFWSVEYALTDYPDGRIPAESLAGNFIEYLIHGRGKLVVEEFGAAACVELATPRECIP